jgi:hypothetical protein
MSFSAFRSSLLQVAFCVACAGAASADMLTVGSVGIVDSADITKIVTNDTSATLSFAQPGQQNATIRYNVSLVPEDPGFGSTRWTLKVRYQDGDPPTSETQRLLVHLKELNLSTGVPTTVLTFDSNVRLTSDPAGSESDWRLGTVSGCRPYDPDSAYFLEAIFSSDATPIAPPVRLDGMALGAGPAGDVGC